MTKGLVRDLNRAPLLDQLLRKVTIHIDQTVTVDGATGVGWGTVPLSHTFPTGFVAVLGCACKVQLTGPTSAGLSDTWAGDFAIGTAAASSASLAGAAGDIVPSTALAAATAEASPETNGLSAAYLPVFDASTAPVSLNLNVLVDDADISADDVDLAAVGSVTIAYTMLGNDLAS